MIENPNIRLEVTLWFFFIFFLTLQCTSLKAILEHELCIWVASGPFQSSLFLQKAEGLVPFVRLFLHCQDTEKVGQLVTHHLEMRDAIYSPGLGLAFWRQ